MIYFDNGATTLQKPEAVYTAVQTAMRRYASPGRGGHPAAMEAAEAVYACRALAGELFDVLPERVAFTLNATHALNIAIKSLVHPGERVVISGFEHNAVVRPLQKLGAAVTVAGTKLFDQTDTLAAFDTAITEDTKAVICTHVSNVFGYVLPVEQIAALCAERGVPFVLDASQSAGTLSVSLQKLQAAFICMPGHKGLYGPQGTGLLLCGTLPDTLLEGGTGSLSAQAEMPDFLPDRAEAGTHNVPGICGLAAGLEFLKQTGTAEIVRHELQLKNKLADYLRALPGLRVFFDETAQSGVLSFVLPDTDCETAAQAMADAGIAVRAGLHCAPRAHQSAGTLETGTIRASFSAFNTLQEVEHAAACMGNIFAK